MGQFNQLVLLASIVASCNSYFIDSTKIMPVPEPPVESSKSDFLEFPTEFMDKLIASLSPQELEELKKPIILAESNLVDRNGNPDITPCRKHLDIRNYQRVKATDGEQYIVVKYQPVIHYACDEVKANDTYGNKCWPALPQKNIGYCCHQRRAKATLQVIPVPRGLFENRNGTLFRIDTNEVVKMIKKEVWMNSDCVCEQIPEIVYTKNYSCPRPTSMLFIE